VITQQLSSNDTTEKIIGNYSKITIDVNCNLISGECMPLGNGSRLFLDNVELTNYYHPHKPFSQIYVTRERDYLEIFSFHIATPSVDLRHFLRVDVQLWFAEDPLEFGSQGQEKLPSYPQIVESCVAMLMHVLHEVNIGNNSRFIGVSNINFERIYCLPQRTKKWGSKRSQCEVVPHLKCVNASTNGTSHAHYSYTFSCKDQCFLPHKIEIPIGPNNRFDPSPEDRGQPTIFYAERQGTVFTVEIQGQDLLWTLGRHYTYAGHYSKPCGSPHKFGYAPLTKMNGRELFDWYQNYLVERMISLNARQRHMHTAYIVASEVLNIDVDVSHVPCGYMDIKVESFLPFCARVERVDTDVVSHKPIGGCAKAKNMTTGLYQRLFLYDLTRLIEIPPWNVTIRRMSPAATPVIVTLNCASHSAHLSFFMSPFLTIVLIVFVVSINIK